MLKFVVRRVLWTIPIILLVIFMTFWMMRGIKGSPFRKSERAVPPAVLANLNRNFGLDKPWYVQYGKYVEDIFTFHLGPSLVLRNQDVNGIVSRTFPVSAELGGLAMLLAILVGVPLGILSALRANKLSDYLAMLFANLGFALPSFLVAVLLIYYFSGQLNWFPVFGWDSWSTKVLPVVALSLGPLTYFARIVRGQMLETLQQDYVRTAKAKGLRWKRVVVVHVLRNSLIPAVTAAGPLLGFLVTGSFIIENIFSIPGIGRYYVTSVNGRDYSTVMAITVLLSILIIVANMVVDILYGFLDPRTRDARS
ncbi:MAG: oligopeptide transport system permease protein [Gaiellaceae bacterium]|nr:oligopeptide transport system permease protein [Gaiellaceae bacterium]